MRAGIETAGERAMMRKDTRSSFLHSGRALQSLRNWVNFLLEFWRSVIRLFALSKLEEMRKWGRGA